MERLLIAARSYINCLTSLTLTMFMERHEEQKRGIIPFLLFLSVFFFLASPPVERRGERERGGGGTEFKLSLESWESARR